MKGLRKMLGSLPVFFGVMAFWRTCDLSLNTSFWAAWAIIMFFYTDPTDWLGEEKRDERPL